MGQRQGFVVAVDCPGERHNFIRRRKLLHAAAPQVNIPYQSNGSRTQLVKLIALNTVYTADRAMGVQRQGQLGRVRRRTDDQ